MKLISQFKNNYNNITYRVYQTNNGIKILHLDNPASIDFNFAIVVKAGSVFEDKEGVPRGTAHFLEHMLLNPNSTFKNKDVIDSFEKGDRETPALDINARTSKKNIYFTGYSNQKGTYRVLNRIDSIIQFPKRKFANQLEKERGIILAEKSRKVKREKDSSLMNLEFLFKDTQPEFAYDNLGEFEDIKSIGIEDLEKYFKKRFVTGNTVFAIQSKGELNKRVIDKLEKISQSFKHDKTDDFKKVELKNEYEVGVFKEDRANGVSISFMYFEKDEGKLDYKQSVKRYISGRLLSWLAFDRLREKKSLIYDFSLFKVNYLSYDSFFFGFIFITEKEKVKQMLKELDSLLYEDIFTFLKTKKGKERFEDIISSYIFPPTTVFDEEAAESSSVSLLEKEEIYNYNLSVREAKKILLDDIVKDIRIWVNTPPHIWVESDMSKKEMLDIIKASPFEKRFNTV